jgi:hypothetical protein
VPLLWDMKLFEPEDIIDWEVIFSVFFEVFGQKAYG